MMFGGLGILNTFSTNIFNLQWVYLNVTPSLVKEHLYYIVYRPLFYFWKLFNIGGRGGKNENF